MDYLNRESGKRKNDGYRLLYDSDIVNNKIKGEYT